MNPLHLSKSVEWFTPLDIIEAARATMGSIDLDPASCEEANRRIKATTYYSAIGLEREWCGNVFLNPPGGKTSGRSNQVLWWNKLCCEVASRRVKQAIFVSFSLELLQTCQLFENLPYHPMDFQCCIPRRRLRYIGSDGSKKSPTHASMIVGVECTNFYKNFYQFGFMTHDPAQ